MSFPPLNQGRDLKFHYTTLETCHTATGLVVVIDVIRAFTNAAFAFSRGAKEIYLVCGEVGGIPPEGFDFGNSPTQTSQLDLTGRVIIQRTGAGTQGIVRGLQAEHMLAASLVIAGATVTQIQKLGPEAVTFVITGQFEDGRGDEDLACAEYLEALLEGQEPDPAPYLERVYRSRDALFHLDEAFPAFPKSDLDHCIAINTFDFAMLVTKDNGRHVIRARKP
jgi:2-phosphosulfolactate phosphatase